MFKENNTVAAFIAYVASKLTGCVRAEDLLRACADAGHFEVQQAVEAFETLVEEGVMEIKGTEQGLSVALGEVGRTILPELAGMLPPSLETDAAAEALREYASAADGVRYRSRTEKTDGGFVFAAGSYMGETPTCEVRLLLPDEKTALAAKAHFEAHPDKTLANVSAIVTGDMEFLL